jgi:hypothetical protein
MNAESLKAKIINTQSTLFQIDQQREQLNRQLEQMQAQYQYVTAIEQAEQKAADNEQVSA